MKIFNSPKAAFAVLLAAILLCTVIYTPSSKADITTHEVKLMMVYDTSFKAFMHSNNMGNGYSERIRQMIVLAGIPFGIQWNVEFDVDVATYASVLGVDPALGCLDMYPYVNSDLSGLRLWDFDESCSCSTHNDHHSNASYYTTAAMNYVNNQVSQDPYDDLGIIVAHKLCWGTDDNHIEVLGLAKTAYPGFIIKGNTGVDSNETGPEQFYNWLSTKNVFSHEISHNFGAHNADNPDSPCDTDCPCVMNVGFDNVVYARDIWCATCHSDFRANRFD